MRVNLKTKLNKKQPKLPNILCNQKIFLFCVNIYKMDQISKEAYKKSAVKIIDKERYFWINRRDLEVEQITIIEHRFLIFVIQTNKNKDTN